MDYDKLIAPAAAAMRPSGIRKFFDLAADMPECISLGVGEPDFKTPWAVREAGIESQTAMTKFFEEHFDNEFMASRFETMSIDPSQATRS